MTTPEPIILRRWKSGSRRLLALFPEDPADPFDHYLVTSIGEIDGTGAADMNVVTSHTVLARLSEPDTLAFFQKLDKLYGPLKVYERETPQMRARREWNWRRMIQVPGTVEVS